jgi:type II secretion system protein G
MQQTRTAGIARERPQVDNNALSRSGMESNPPVRTLLVLLTLSLLAACADPVEEAKEAVKAGVTHPRGIDYRDLQVLRNDVVCGEFMEDDRWGEGPGFQPFIFRGGKAHLRPSELDLKIFCSPDPASALQSELGIGPVSRQNTSLVKVYSDLSTLAAALEAYKADFGEYPSVVKMKGLQALTKPRRGSPDPKDTYIAEIPLDPWGQEYTYHTPRILHGAKDKYELFTLGRDGKIGGTGEDADIGSHHLAYLDHVGGL